MQNPREGESVQRLRRRMVYHDAQLGAEPNFAALVEPSKAVLAKIDDFGNGTRDADDTVTRSIAIRDRQERRTHKALDALDLDLLALVGRDRKDARYILAYSGNNMSALKRLSPTDKAEALQTLVDAMDDEDGGLTSLKGDHQTKLRDVAQALKIAETDLQSAIEARDKRRTKRTLLRLETQRLLEKNFSVILGAHPHDKDEVELYFYAFATASRAEDKDL